MPAGHSELIGWLRDANGEPARVLLRVSTDTIVMRHGQERVDDGCYGWLSGVRVSCEEVGGCPARLGISGPIVVECRSCPHGVDGRCSWCW
jgi:hypothetical protein